MRNILYLTSFLFFLCACTSEEKSMTQTSDHESSGAENDSLNAERVPETVVLQSFPKQLNTRIADFDTLALPFHLKHEDLDNFESPAELNRSQFSFLYQNFDKTGIDDYTYIKDASEMYDLKNKGEYEAYVAHLDLAQLRDATAHPFGQINLDTAVVLLWTVNYSSFEACPFYAGTDLYASVVQNDSVQTTVFLGNESSGGDPPSFGETLLQLKISEQLSTKRTSTYKTYEDEELLESSESTVSSFILW